MTSQQPIEDPHQAPANLDSGQERDRERGMTLAVSVGALMIAMRRGGLSGLALGAFSGLLAYRASTGRGLKGTGRDLVHCAERTLTGHRVGPLDLSATATINAPPEALYAFWRDFTQLPQVMSAVDDIQVMTDGHPRWRAHTPTGDTLEWDTELTNDVPGQRIAWRSLEGADIPHSGEIRFMAAAPGHGTEVALRLHYAIPHRLLAAAPLGFVKALSQEALREDLLRFKQIMEIGGEVPTAAIHPAHSDRDIP